jgi:hypothetical protein
MKEGGETEEETSYRRPKKQRKAKKSKKAKKGKKARKGKTKRGKNPVLTEEIKEEKNKEMTLEEL